MTILPLKSNGHGMVWIAKMSQLKTIVDQDISTNVWMLASLVSFSSFNREADQLLSCNSVYEKTFMIPKWMQEMLKLRISKKRMNKGVATQKVITFSKRVVDLQPTHNRFLHFSSLCLSLRLFWGISVCLLVWFGLRSVHGLERNVQCIFQSRLHFPISAPVGMAWNSSFLILLASLNFNDFATAKNPCKTEVSVLGMALKGFVFKRVPVTAPHVCDITCKRETICQSYNYVIGEKSCELNTRTKEARPENFQPDDLRFYMGRISGRSMYTV